MSVKTTTTWTCDRCETTETFDSPDRQPMGWLRLLSVTPPKGSTNDLARERGTICTGCSDDFDEWLVVR